MQQFKDLTVLMADDMEVMRKVTATQLRMLGIDRVTMVSNGAEALRTLNSQRFDIVLSDWNMPVMTGIELLKAVRSDNALWRLPFVMITAEADRKRIEEAIQCGVSDLLVKPYTPDRLAASLERALSRKIRTPLNSANVAEPVTRDSAAPPKEVEAREERPVLLLVDDAPDNLQLLAQLFKSDYRVRVASSGEAALSICFSDQPPDLVLLDVMMPDMDGFEVAKRMREYPNSATIPVIFVTAMDGDDARLKGMSLGAVDFVTKPIVPEQLQLRVRNFIRYVMLRKETQSNYDSLLETARIREDVENLTRHDMKGSLAGVISLVQELANDDMLTGSQAETVRVIEDATLKLLNMINLSAELYKIETGRFELDPQPMDIGDMLHRIANISRKTFAGKRIAIAVDAGVSPGEVEPRGLGDAMLSYSIFQNLIKNACEAAPANSRVSIAVTWQDMLRITIVNQGVIPAEIRDAFFGKYVTHGKPHGTGLGAYSAKSLTEAQGGQIAFEVSDEQKTTTLVVTLPMVPAV
ncbi:ATP-binding response regulator [Chitinolyticbacter albus]|uniref:ATP-binding response regulator n=1 Tax=Chitinolyticbacter albus TaxID=2961951 RepID=UPI00210963C0|nr:response regulator [Chitinolyticbacter albus]